MFVRKKKRPNGHTVVQLVENQRNESTTVQTVLRHFGTATNDTELEALIALAEALKTEMEHAGLVKAVKTFTGGYGALLGTLQEIPDKEKVRINQLEEKARTILGIHDIYGAVYDTIGFGNLFSNAQRRTFSAKILRDIVLARIARPASKRETVNFLSEQFGVTLNLEHVYQMMDKMDDLFFERIQKCSLAMTLKLTGEKLRIVFYDATTLYFESFSEDDLKKNGYSKDMKFNQPQVLLTLFVTEKGLPVGYELFPGNTFEGHTLVPVLEKLKKRYQLDEVVVVADRGLLSEENLSHLENNQIKYIVGARIKNVKKQLQSKILDMSNYKKLTDDVMIAQFDNVGNRKIIVSHSQDRASKDAYDRKKAVDKITKKIQMTDDPKGLISNYGYKKYIDITGDSKISLNQAKLKNEQQWDGLHGVVTNIKDMQPEDVLQHYRGLWQIEESFRINKHDLRMRPIYHWTPHRIKAHIAIAFMSFVCVRYLEYRLSVQSEKISPEIIRQSLLQVQASTVYDHGSKKTFVLPSKVSSHAKEIYRVMGAKIPKHPVMVK